VTRNVITVGGPRRVEIGSPNIIRFILNLGEWQATKTLMTKTSKKSAKTGIKAEAIEGDGLETCVIFASKKTLKKG